MLQTHNYNSEIVEIMTPKPPERISFILLKSFARQEVYCLIHEEVMCDSTQIFYVSLLL